MKKNLISLAAEAENIRKCARQEFLQEKVIKDFIIYDIPEFIIWKQKVLLELKLIPKKDSFVQDAIFEIDMFSGFEDRQRFDKLTGSLRAIVNNIDNYYQEETNIMTAEERSNMLFISHATADRDYIKAFIELLEVLGLQEDEIVCSSIPPYCVPLGGKVYEWLVDKFQNNKLHVIYMLSQNYYNSAASLNEMGAAWAMKQKWDAVLLPGFEFKDISGCIDPTQIGIKLDDPDMMTLKFRIGELKNTLIKEFGLRSMSEALWERKRDDFLNKIKMISEERSLANERETEELVENVKPYRITKDASVLLAYASDDPHGQIVVISYLGGTTISAGGVLFNRDNTAREIARWTSAVDELIHGGYIKRIGKRDKIYEVTHIGYIFSDQVKTEFKIDTSCDLEMYIRD